MSFFSELKRRNVFRVATAYVVGSWLIIQVAEATFPAFGLGDSVLRLVIVLLAIAFVPALVFSWAFEITPQGLRREVDVVREHSITRFTGKKIDRIIMVLLALGLAVFAFDKFVLDPIRVQRIAESAHQKGAEQAREEVRLGRFDDKSVAVLPFANRSPAPEDAWFADGLHDELLTQLGRISALKVISRTSVEKYRNTDKSVPEIARELSVASILEGGVQRAGGQVRINVQLIDGRTDEHLWGRTFDRELTTENLFAIQSEVTARIAEALDAELTPQQEQQLFERPTTDMAAYELYLRGRAQIATRNTQHLRQALQAFEDAVALDPEFAQAWVGVAVASMLLGDQGVIGRAETTERERQALDRALALDDQLGEAYASLGMLHWREEPSKAEAAFRNAIELSPNYSHAYMWYANFLSGAANYEKRLALYFKAAELDPLSSVNRNNIAGTLRAMGREEEGLQHYERGLQLDPDYWHTYLEIGLYHAQHGRLAEAVKWYREAERLNPDSGPVLVALADVYIALEDLDAIRAVRDTMQERLDPHSFGLAYVNFYIDLLQSGWQATLLLDRPPEQLPPSYQLDLARSLGYLIGGHYAEAYEHFLRMDPGWADPEQWPRQIMLNDGGCYVAGLMIGAGEVKSGRDLLRQSMRYLQEELPRYVRNTDRYWNLGLCYLLEGSHEEALDFFEQYITRGYWGDWNWSYVRYLPFWSPLREHPRYIALMARLEDLKAEQRELIRRLDDPADG